MNNSEQPANAIVVKQRDAYGAEFNKTYYGLTKREYFAAKAMQGFFPIFNLNSGAIPTIENIEYMTALSVLAADTLLKELEKQTP